MSVWQKTVLSSDKSLIKRVLYLMIVLYWLEYNNQISNNRIPMDFFRRRNFEAALSQMSWKVKFEDIQFVKGALKGGLVGIRIKTVT